MSISNTRQGNAQKILTNLLHLVRKLAIIVSIEPTAVRLKNATHASWPCWPPPKKSYALNEPIGNVDVNSQASDGYKSQ